jgi:hypothetical protein
VNCNLRTEFLWLLRRAGLKPWPRAFHTLRASCETDLMEEFPMSAVTESLGHSAAVALKLYARVPDHLFERAAVGAEPGAAVGDRHVLEGGHSEVATGGAEPGADGSGHEATGADKFGRKA